MSDKEKELGDITPTVKKKTKAKSDVMPEIKSLLSNLYVGEYIKVLMIPSNTNPCSVKVLEKSSLILKAKAMMKDKSIVTWKGKKYKAGKLFTEACKHLLWSKTRVCSMEFNQNLCKGLTVHLD